MWRGWRGFEGFRRGDWFGRGPADRAFESGGGVGGGLENRRFAGMNGQAEALRVSGEEEVLGRESGTVWGIWQVDVLENVSGPVSYDRSERVE